MCGIAGFVGGERAVQMRAVVELINDAQAHRGPDDSAVVVEGRFVLANTRLAVKGPGPEGNQPFRSPSGRFVVVFNGEIYNAAELAQRHHLPVRTTCDGEVIPLLWERFGPACLDDIRGMYAIAVADTETQRLFLARDPFGIKPLYYRTVEGGTLFASEVKPLWRTDRSAAVDGNALAGYLRRGAMEADASPFIGIDAVAPGVCLSFGTDGNVRNERTNEAIGGTLPGNAPDTLAGALRDSVSFHLRSDVPTALLLSAGVDSTLIALAAKELGVSLHCLSITGALGQDESWQARATAAEYGHTHETVPATIDGSVVGEFFDAMQRPSIDGINTFLVSRAVKSAGFKVALTGLGGDEALAGYSYASFIRAIRFLRFADRLPRAAVDRFLAAAVRRLPVGNTDKISRLTGVDGPRDIWSLIALQRELFSAERLRDLLLVDPGPERGRSSRWTAGRSDHWAVAEAEIVQYLEPMLLADADAFSMACSVELRVPFVDVVFFEAALGRSRVKAKKAMVDEMSDRYLQLLARRDKTGFSVPMSEWMAGGVLRDFLAAAAQPDAPVWGYVDRRRALPLLQGFDSGSRWSEAWSVVALDAWLRSL